MTLHEDARERLADVRELEPTTNGELRDRWGMSSGREVHQYLTTELADYTYRDDSNKIRTRTDVNLSGESESDSLESESGAGTGTQSVEDERDHFPANGEGTTEPGSAADGKDMDGTGTDTNPSSEGYSVGEMADIVETAVGEARSEAVEQATTGGDAETGRGTSQGGMTE